MALPPDATLDAAEARARLAYCLHGALHMNTRWRRHVWIPPVRRLLEPFEQFRDASVLEIGPGNGRMSCLFAALGASVVACDIAPVEGARAEARRWGLATRVELHRYDGDPDSLPSERFDFVFTKSTLGFSDRTVYERLVAAIAERVAPGGTGLFIENVCNPLLTFYRRHIRYRRSRWDVYDFGLTREGVRVIERAFPRVEVMRHSGLVWTIRARSVE